MKPFPLTCLFLCHFLGASPSTALPTHEEIRDLARQGLLDSAFNFSQEILESNPRDTFAQFMLAKLNPNGNASAEAFKRTLRTGAKNKEVEESYFRLGQYYYAAGKYVQSITYFRDYLKKFPMGTWTSPTLYWAGNACLAFAGVKISYLDSAIQYFNLLQKSQNSTEYYFTLALEGKAKALVLKGERPIALEAAMQALANAPEEEKGTILLLLAQINSGLDAMEEKKYLGQVISQYPQSPEARYLKKINSGIESSRWKSGVRSSKSEVKKRPQLDSTNGPENRIKALGNTKPKPSQSVPVGEKNFTLQLGAFSQKANAELMKLQLIKLGFAPELISSQKNGKYLFQVRLGKFDSPEEAAEFAQINLRPHQLLSTPIPISP